MIRLTRSGLHFSNPGPSLERLRSDFERNDFVRLPGFLARDLAAIVRREIDRAEFYERTHAGIDDNKELCMRPNATAAGLLHLLLNAADVFQAVETITGCGTIGCFMGRVYRVVPGQGHRDAWHSDVGRHRLVTMSINLSPRPYLGGTLQMRAVGSTRILRSVPNLGFGDALLFRIDRGHEHRITDIEGVAAKTAFAGWFQAKPSFRALIDRRSRAVRNGRR